MSDLAIVGGGPAALTAAIYASRNGLDVTVYEQTEFGGALPNIAEIENYPGFGGAGRELAQRMREQASASGARLEYGACTALTPTPSGFTLTIDDEPVSARAVLVATGSAPRRVEFDDLATPISYCALCDGPLARDRRVAVLGGANSAIQEALFLSHLAASVDVITHSRVKADPQLVARLGARPNVRIIEQTEPSRELLAAYDYCFAYIGRIPATSCLADVAAGLLDDDGYAITLTDSDFPHQTVVPGLFAAGDVRQGVTRQIITAAADGAEAALEITRLLA